MILAHAVLFISGILNLAMAFWNFRNARQNKRVFETTMRMLTKRTDPREFVFSNVGQGGSGVVKVSGAGGGGGGSYSVVGGGGGGGINPTPVPINGKTVKI